MSTTNPFARLQNLPPPNPQPITESIMRLSEATLRECARAHQITFNEQPPLTEAEVDDFDAKAEQADGPRSYWRHHTPIFN